MSAPQPRTSAGPGIGHQMILASAGSGKTYALTNRFVGLLARDVAPHRILALTFTRKAAAEFLDEILRKLANAALDERFAAGLAEQLGPAGTAFNSSRATELLRRLVNALHLLTLGTLDSFFHRILNCFPAEFGLDSAFEIMEEHEAAELRSRVLAQIFRDPGAHEEFLTAFKASTFGGDGKSLVTVLDRFIREHHALYLRAPRREQWGDPATIWGASGCAWLEDQPDVAGDCRSLARALEVLEMDKTAARMWTGFLEELPGLLPGTPRPKAISGTLLERLFEQYEAICGGGPAELQLGRKRYTAGKPLCAILKRLLHHLLACGIRPPLERTRGIFDLVQMFEARYHEGVRRAGKLGFEDVQLLLSGLLPGAGGCTALSLDGGEDRLDIEYRLDGQFDHWLLDEFQDTSLPQWRVIENLVDEVVQDASDRRSFFYVGDIKQAIFGWRGGDSHLFQDIYDYYSQSGSPRIARETMELSWRSGPHLLDCVNRVFGNPQLLAGLFPEHGDAVRRWNEEWRPHRSQHPGRADCFRLVTLPKAGPEGLSKSDRRLRAVAALLEEIAPRERNLSCAILVRANSCAHELADYLRANTSIEVMVDGDCQVGCDHPLGTAFLALLQLAAHPGDTFAWKHLCMTPAFAAEPARQSAMDRRQLSAQVRGLLHDRGFRAVFDYWLQLLNSGGFEPDAFAHRRMEQLRQACREFDQGGNRSVPEFLRYATALAARETPAEGVVQILTIHKSKGLGFDAVIVAEIDGEKDRALTTLGNEPLLIDERGRGLKREIGWILSMPPKDVCQVDPALRAARLRLENEQLFEALCVLYVALTRAKHATYVVGGEPGDAASFPAMLHQALCLPGEPGREWRCGDDLLRISFEAGDAQWFDSMEIRKRKTQEPAADEGPAPCAAAARSFPALPRSRPSAAAEEAAAVSPGEFFAPNTTAAADFGTRVHALFEQVEWLESLPGESLAAHLELALDPRSAIDRDALAAVLQAVRQPEIAAMFRKDSFGRDARVWRERRFELVLDGCWVSGTFDRVVLAGGRGWIFDFKTNRVSSGAEVAAACAKYASQMATYRCALARLARIPEGAISAHLVFTHPGLLRAVFPDPARDGLPRAATSA